MACQLLRGSFFAIVCLLNGIASVGIVQIGFPLFIDIGYPRMVLERVGLFTQCASQLSTNVEHSALVILDTL